LPGAAQAPVATAANRNAAISRQTTQRMLSPLGTANRAAKGTIDRPEANLSPSSSGLIRGATGDRERERGTLDFRTLLPPGLARL
jgi:hypothetical protein